MTRTSKKIDPVVFAAHALKQVKSLVDYNRVVSANSEATITAAWQALSADEQQRITDICKDSPPPDLNAIADEIIACGTHLQLQAVKASHGEHLVRQAWKNIPIPERQRIKALCEPGQKKEEYPPVIEQSQQISQPQQPKTRTLFSISDDLEKLNELLDDCGDDAQQQELIQQWFEQLGEERDRKLDGYAALISEMMARAEVRKAEARRMQELAQADENRARLLKNRLKLFFELHELKTVQTSRYKLSVTKNGGKQPLILKDGISPVDLPEQFQSVSVDANTIAIRDFLERGEVLEWARLGERGTSMRIK